MRKVTIVPLVHRGEAQVAIHFDYNEQVRTHVRAFTGVRYSATHRCFYFNDTMANRAQFFSHIREKGWYLDYSAFKTTPRPKREPTKKPKPVHPSKELYEMLPPSHKKTLTGFTRYLRGLRLSTSTVRVYGYFILRLLYANKNVEVQDIGKAEAQRYLETEVAEEGYSISSHRQCVSALKHFGKYANCEALLPEHLHRPKKEKKLPSVLSKEEVIDLLRHTRNLKHRTILALIYSGGLRIGELLRLRLCDIDLDRMQLHIKCAKGRKDRTVSLAIALQPLLANYLHTYCPTHYIIEGRGNTMYSGSSVRRFLRKSCQRAGIRKEVTPHTLRHSYATHLMDNGVGLRHIQQLLGHAKPETTMIYTHVSTSDMLSIENPLDRTISQLTDGAKDAKKVLLSRNL